jgi:hypothetical protein
MLTYRLVNQLRLKTPTVEEKVEALTGRFYRCINNYCLEYRFTVV